MDAAIEELEYTIKGVEYRIEQDLINLKRNREWLLDAQARFDKEVKKLGEDQLLLDSLLKALIVLKDYNDS